MNKILIVCLFSIITAEISNDSLSVLINEGKVQILEEVTYVDPLVGKKMGVEINPLYTMAYDEDGFNFSGTFSLFPKGQNAEIAFPFSKKTTTDFLFNHGIDEGVETTFNIDAQYRYFLGKYRKGVYIMGGLRYSNHEEEGDSYDEEFINSNYDKIGISFGVGWRIFGGNGLYWGCSIYYGKYYFGSDEGPDSFMNLEFFKFGKTF